MKSHAGAFAVFLLAVAIPFLCGTLYTAYCAEILHEKILFGWGMVPFAVIVNVVLASAWYGLAALFAAFIHRGRFSPRGIGQSMVTALCYFGFFLILEQTHHSDFVFWIFLSAPVLSFVLFRRETRTTAAA